MGKTVVLEGSPLRWARERFQTFYGAAVVEPPSELAQREFAWFPFTTESLMRRHEALPTIERFKEFARREVPRHVYYSSAYFEAPGHPTMAGKGWQGADVLFDLDADHLRGASELDFAGQLALVKDRARELYDDFLRRDFGIEDAQMRLVFSGGRGYHVHVQDEAYLGLGSTERREIVDYVIGTGVEPRSFVVGRRAARAGGAVELDPEGAIDPSGPRDGRGRAEAFSRLPEASAPGWPGRVSRSFHRTLQRWEREGTKVAAHDVRLWAGAGSISPQRASALARALVDDGAAAKIRETGSLEFLRPEAKALLIDVVLRQAKIEVQGETDAPVTTDLHRLIRLPGSLHGGTGFRVTPLTRERLDTFDPFRDALPFVGPGRTEVRLGADARYPFDPALEGKAGEVLELPDAVALFLVLRGEATLPPVPVP